MVPLTRRRLLRGTAGVTALLAGCNGLGKPDGSTRTASPPADRGGTGPATDSTTTPETVRVRAADGRPPVWLAEPEGGGGRPVSDDRSRHLSSIVVDSRSRAERVEVADLPAAESARSFLADTSFDSETVYVQNHRVRACFRLDLCRISWRPTTVETDYARTLLPYDERCAADGWAAESWLVRIPAALSEADVNGYGTSVGSAGCDRTAARGDAAGGRGSADTAGDVAPASQAAAPESADTGGER